MVQLDGNALTLNTLERVALQNESVAYSTDAKTRIQAARQVIEDILARGDVVYGVNTGFGKLSDVHIPSDQLERLQLNLVRSHACGLGQPLSQAEVRAMLLLRANVLAKGHSGVRLEVAETLIAMLNAGVHPVVPEKGSVGASGDLAPLAHLAMGVIGEGECEYQGERMASAEALRRAGIAPVKLGAKEGLALLNGTQAMASVGGLAMARALRLLRVANVAGAMTLEALLGTPVAFDPRIQSVRHHSGQAEVAEHLRTLVVGSEIRESHVEGDTRVQDAYSLRCMPQVHGAALGALQHVASVIENETGAATDNPLIFPKEGDVLSGGNFHGAPLALAFDYAAIAMTDLMSISERRIDRLVNPDLNERLPAFLTSDPGTSSGFMIPQVAAVALLAEARVLAHPSSVDNAPTSAGKEDHVSMGMTGALKLRAIVDLAERVYAIELLAAAEGLEYRRPLRSGDGVEKVFASVREVAPRVSEDRSLSSDFERLASAIRTGAISA